MILFIAGWIIGILIGLFISGIHNRLTATDSLKFTYSTLVKGLNSLRIKILNGIKLLRNK